MTSLELKIKYRFDTGCSPTFGKDKTGYNYQSGLTQEYAKWLEEYAGDYTGMFSMKWQRTYFKQDTGTNATFIGRKGNLCYTRAYKEYIEELLCKSLTALGQ